MAHERAEKRSKLNERLAKRKAAMARHIYHPDTPRWTRYCSSPDTPSATAHRWIGGGARRIAPRELTRGIVVQAAKQQAKIMKEAPAAASLVEEQASERQEVDEMAAQASMTKAELEAQEQKFTAQIAQLDKVHEDQLAAQQERFRALQARLTPTPLWS